MTYWTAEDDGLQQSWQNYRVFVNPPYSGAQIQEWCGKCYEERNNAELIVLLIPLNKASTGYFHEYIYPIVDEIRFIRGRLKFVPLVGQKQSSNPLGSMLCIIKRGR